MMACTFSSQLREFRAAANQRLLVSHPANGVSLTSPLPSPYPPITVFSICGSTPPPPHLHLAPRPCYGCRQLPWRHCLSHRGAEHVWVLWGSWRTGRPRPVWAATTGWSQINPRYYSRGTFIFEICFLINYKFGMIKQKVNKVGFNVIFLYIN